MSILKKATVSSKGEVKQTPEIPGVFSLDDIHVGHIIQVNIFKYHFETAYYLVDLNRFSAILKKYL